MSESFKGLINKRYYKITQKVEDVEGSINKTKVLAHLLNHPKKWDAPLKEIFLCDRIIGSQFGEKQECANPKKVW
jgi:hypothetical protein